MRFLTEIEIFNEIDRLRDENCDKLVIIGKDEKGNEVVYDGRPFPTKRDRERGRKLLKEREL